MSPLKTSRSGPPASERTGVRIASRKVREAMHLLDKRLGYVINFGMASLKDGVVRLVNKLTP